MKYLQKIRERGTEYLNVLKISRRLLGTVWQVDRWLFLGSAAAASLPGIIPFINAYIYKLLIDQVVAVYGGARLNPGYLILLLSCRFATLFLQDLANAASSYFDILTWTKFPTYLYQAVLSKLAGLDVGYFEDSNFKNRLEKVKETYNWRVLNMISALFACLPSLCQFIIALGAITFLNPWLTLPILLVAVPAFINQTAYAKISWGVWEMNSENRKKFWYLSDLLQGGISIKEIKIFQMAGTFLDELMAIYNKFVRENTQVLNKQFIFNALFSILQTVVYMGIEVFIVLRALARRITIGDITYYTTVLINFQSGVTSLFRNFTQIYDQSQYVGEMFTILDTVPLIPHPEQPVPVDPQKTPKIEFKNVTFIYPGSTQKALDRFTLTINPGQKIALVGENGAGKTTLIKLLARFYDVTSGEILINGTNIKEIDLSSWYKTLGVLFQDFIRYEYPLKENIHFGKAENVLEMKEIIRAAQASGASDVAKRLPKGYDQMLGKIFDGGIDLSAGQWQKVALARGFLRSAPVLILDEPTAAIDAKAEAEIFNKVEQLAKDKTVIIISHRFSTVRNADKIYVIDAGRIVESGNHNQLLVKNGIYASLFKLQAKAYR
jgi:ATP-binding cassette subfamily B protein